MTFSKRYLLLCWLLCAVSVLYAQKPADEALNFEMAEQSDQLVFGEFIYYFGKKTSADQPSLWCVDQVSGKSARIASFDPESMISSPSLRHNQWYVYLSYNTRDSQLTLLQIKGDGIQGKFTTPYYGLKQWNSRCPVFDLYKGLDGQGSPIYSACYFDEEQLTLVQIDSVEGRVRADNVIYLDDQLLYSMNMGGYYKTYRRSLHKPKPMFVSEKVIYKRADRRYRDEYLPVDRD